MPRNISFALTTPQFLDGSKDVTRRNGWLMLKTGDILRVSLENVPLEQMLAKALDLLLTMPELALQRKGAILRW